MAPSAPSGVVKTPPSPATTSVLVTSVPIRPTRPVRGICTPCSFGWFRTLSGVSPWAICQMMSPLFRSIAVIRPHGGLSSGRPSTVSCRSTGLTPGRRRVLTKSMSDRSGSLIIRNAVTCDLEY